MKQISIVAACLSFLLLNTAAWGGEKDDPDLVIVTGIHWTTASRDEKVAYLFGIGNMLEVEQAMQGKNPSSHIRNNSIVPVMIKGLSGQSTTELRKMLDQWYENKPD
ncbi:MAG: hypothetical protein IZT60_07345, partial [Gammaproteobacteria bacterium]|nr:hypothetical protein [Gammaproteobacteria bacterium]